MNVLELFAGVGGFRVGLENADKDFFKTKWANQWEPSRKSQDAFDVYNYHFSDSENLNISISDISDEKFASMDANMIVGGFPCQDYSVARSKKNEKGIEGKKGVLFWDIIRATENIKPKYLILENVDRLLKAPSKQRGRDFAIMLTAFNNLGYSVEWRVINAAEYGRSQRRRRVFFFVYRNDTDFAKTIDKKYDDLDLPGRTMLTSEGTVNRSTHFLKVNGKYCLITPIEAERLQDFPDNWTAKKKLADGSIVEVSDKMRMFFMGNALVTEIVKEIANFIRKIEK